MPESMASWVCTGFSMGPPVGRSSMSLMFSEALWSWQQPHSTPWFWTPWPRLYLAWLEKGISEPVLLHG